MKLPIRISGHPWWVYLLYLVTLLALQWPQGTQARRSRYHSSRRRTSSAPGPNMCQVQEVIGTKQRFFTHCVAKHLRVICERPTYSRWECCPGFRRKGRDRGCIEEKPLGNLVELMDELDLNHIHSYVNHSAELRSDLAQYGPYTIFVPSDSAVEEAPEAIREEISGPDSALLKYHIAPGRLNISMFRKKNQEFVTLLNGEKVRLNKYSYGVATVNCARIIRPDELATNGIIHVTDKVITPRDMDSTLAQRIFKDDRFSQFQLALFASGMINTLKKERASFTVLAPTNQAFAKLPNDLIDRILTDADTAENVVKRHIVHGVICTDAVVVSIGLKTVDGARLLFRCKKDGIHVNEALVTSKDMVASNGVLHGIDTVLIPDSVKKASELMYDMHLDKFLDMAQKAGLNTTFDEDDDITVFSPSNTAMRRIPYHYLAALIEKPLKMKNFLKYHIVKGRLTESTLVGDTTLDTKSDAKSKIKVNIYRDGILVDKASLNSYPRQCRNAVIHTVEDVLIPNEDTFMDIIENDPELSIFELLYKSTGLDRTLSSADMYTLIAPTNRAFRMLDPLSWTRVASDPKRLRQFLYRHVINRMVLKCSIPARGVYGIKSVQGDQTEFTIDTLKRVYLNKHARAVSEDILAANGVVYKVDHVLPCSCERTLRTKKGQYISSYRYYRG